MEFFDHLLVLGQLCLNTQTLIFYDIFATSSNFKFFYNCFYFMAFLLFALHKLGMSMNQFQQMASRNLVCNCFLFIFHCFLPMDTLDTFEVPCTAEQSLLGTLLLVPLNCKAALDQNRLQNSWFLAKRCFHNNQYVPFNLFWFSTVQHYFFFPSDSDDSVLAGSPLCQICFSRR